MHVNGIQVKRKRSGKRQFHTQFGNQLKLTRFELKAMRRGTRNHDTYLALLL